MKKSLGVILAALAVSTAAPPALAHHNANAQWYTEKKMELTGVLREVRDINPHAQWMFDVTDANGKVEKWHFEAISANALRRQGIVVKQMIKPGQTYKLVYSPSRDGTKTGFLVGLYLNGKRVDFVRL